MSSNPTATQRGGLLKASTQREERSQGFLQSLVGGVFYHQDSCYHKRREGGHTCFQSDNVEAENDESQIGAKSCSGKYTPGAARGVF